MKISDFKIRTRLACGFLFVIMFTLGVNGMGLYQMRELADLINQIYSHPLTVGYTARDIRSEIDRMNANLQRLAFASNSTEREEIKRWINQASERVHHKFDLLKERFLGDNKDIIAAHDAFVNWKNTIDDEFHAIQTGSISHFDKAFYVSQMDRMDSLQSKMQVMIDYAAGKARSFLDTAITTEESASKLMIALTLATLVFSLAVAFFITRSISSPLQFIVARMRDIAEGDLTHDLTLFQKDEIGELADTFRVMQISLRNKADVAKAISSGDFSQSVEVKGIHDILGNAIMTMTRNLKKSNDESTRQDWFKTGKNELSRALVGQNDIYQLTTDIVGFLSRYLSAQIGAMYIMNQDQQLTLTGSYAFSKRKSLGASVDPGEGLVGQAAIEKEVISITDIPKDYIRIRSSLGESRPRNIVAVPLVYEKTVKGVIELGSFSEFSDDKLKFLYDISHEIAIVIHTVQNHDRVKELLEQTQEQAEKLQAQEEKLRVTNEELESQTQSLRRSEQSLTQQQEELRVINEELEEKNEYLEQQKAQITKKNNHLEKLRLELENRAKQLEVTSKYKSEFLANMSHELRTPLNSLLILSRDLAANTQENLDAGQVESAHVIHNSGTALLDLINDILDLSKIEAGRMSLKIEEIPFKEIMNNLEQSFKHVAQEKGIELAIYESDALPRQITTDSQRLQQILNNLVANALKFTERGSVIIRVQPPQDKIHLGSKILAPEECVAFVVQDTGIGVPLAQQMIIFEAFQQADGGTSRKYGGTGLGLSISREIAHLLGGEIQLASRVDEGSTFTLYLPLLYVGPGTNPVKMVKTEVADSVSRGYQTGNQTTADIHSSEVHRVPDDRDHLTADDRSILIIEDDGAFAKILLEQCHRKGFKGLVANTGESGLNLAQMHSPTAIILDIKLPGMNGWTVLNTLKENPATRHIPVHIMSAEETSLDALQRGAIGFLTKPVNRQDLDTAFERVEQMVAKKIKDLLIVEDDPLLRQAIVKLLNDTDVGIIEVESGEKAMVSLKKTQFDCMILDLGLPDMSGFDLLQRIEKESDICLPPVIVYTGRELSREEDHDLRKYSESIIIKGVRSEDRLLDEVSLFLHKTIHSMPVDKKEMLIRLHDRDTMFTGKTILLVDDDMRNLFALSKILTEREMNVLKAEDGQKALTLLENHPEIDLVILDIMLPVMDGYQTARTIRDNPRHKHLPIIALTAKALRDDRNLCLEAGASDYMSKPVDIERLLSMMRVWLYKRAPYV